MDIIRNDYVEQLYAMSWNGKVKIITGIRRCGKSGNELPWMNEEGVMFMGVIPFLLEKLV